MKTLLRSFVFTYVAFVVTDIIVGGFWYGQNPIYVIFIVVLGLTLLSTFLVPTLNLISLPSGGISYIFLSFVFNTILLYIFTVVIPQFEIVATELSELNILGFVLPSKNLTQFWSVVLSSLLLTLVQSVFIWLCKGKGKR